jgi:hypothetical protein
VVAASLQWNKNLMVATECFPKRERSFKSSPLTLGPGLLKDVEIFTSFFVSIEVYSGVHDLMWHLYAT